MMVLMWLRAKALGRRWRLEAVGGSAAASLLPDSSVPVLSLVCPWPSSAGAHEGNRHSLWAGLLCGFIVALRTCSPAANDHVFNSRMVDQSNFACYVVVVNLHASLLVTPHTNSCFKHHYYHPI